MTVEAYPLSWPLGRPRTKFRSTGPFRSTLASARESVLNELRLMDVANIVISTNLRLRIDGLPRADERNPADPGVAVYFTWNKAQHCMACDKWSLVEDNMRAITLHLSSIRGQLRWGVGDVAAAFAGFRQLPGVGVKKPWWEILGMGETRDRTRVQERFHELIQRHHPDRGGNPNQAAEITAAYNEAMEALA